MIDSIFVATSGMLGFERALNVISNNVANLSTAGFRGSNVSFANVFSGTAQNGEQNEQFVGQQGLGGGGLDATRTVLDMSPGGPQKTGQELDLFLQGGGFFVLHDQNGAARYTRDGSFSFNTDGVLVANDAAKGQTLTVMSRDSTGQLAPITIKGLETSAARPTTQVSFSQSLDPTDTDYSVKNVVVYDQQGIAHTLRVEFVKDSSSPGSPPPVPPPPANAAVSWTVKVFEGDTQVGSSDLAFNSDGGFAGTSTLPMILSLPNGASTNIQFDFSAANGKSTSVPNPSDPTNNSNLAFSNQDGFAPGTITARTFDNQGILQITYSNGQKATGGQLVFAQIADTSGLVELGSSLFTYQGTLPVVLREAGSDLQVQSQTLEASNVDLTSEFSTLILMQRGFQGSSQVVSTANDMLQQLLDMKNGR